jgi:hypothetical protein
MDNLPLGDREETGALRDQLLARVGGPSFLRRARDMEDELAVLVTRCQQQRTEWLERAQARLGVVLALAGGVDGLRPLLADEAESDVMARLAGELGSKPATWIEPTGSVRVLVEALDQLKQSLERFNRRWEAYLPTVDRTAVNAARDRYNRYYVLEKECATGSPKIARMGFRRQDPLTVADLAAMLPPLPVPRTRLDVG